MDNNNLVFEETSNSGITDNNDDDDLDVVVNYKNVKDFNFMPNRSVPLMGFARDYDDDDIKEMFEKEIDFKPGNDYLQRLLSSSSQDFEFRLRNKALDWIWKACVHHHFGPLCVYLSMNYLDRFLTSSELPKDKDWAVQLLAVSCLSLAAKMEETDVPQSVDLQVGDPEFVFEAKTVKRMELLVLNTLNWRMQVVTPFSFVDYFVRKISNDQSLEDYVIRSSQLILETTKEVEFLDFKPSEIAAAAAIAISFSGEADEVHIERALSSLIHGNQERVAKCLKMMRVLSNKITQGEGGAALVPQKRLARVPESPNGVLEAMCLSYKSDDLTTIGSCASSSNSSPNNNNSNKRRKQQ